MLQKLWSAFKQQPAPQPPLPDPDTELALGALLVRVAMSDREYQFEEISLIDRILARMFKHDAIEAAKIRATCERLHAAAPDTNTFAALIRETTSVDDRLAALDALWEVVLADGTQDTAEMAILEDVRVAFGLSPADSEAARTRVLEMLAD